MERFQEARQKALANLKAADHILNVTYPLLKDTRLLLGVLDSIFLSVTNSMSAILRYELFFKEIPPFHDNFESKLTVFQQCAQKYSINTEYIKLMREIKDIIVLHRKSKIEFRKQDRFIICSDDYAVTTVTANQLKDYIKKAKELFMLMDNIVEHERILRGSEGRIEAR